MQEALLPCWHCIYPQGRVLGFERRIQQTEHRLGPSRGNSEPQYKLHVCSK